MVLQNGEQKKKKRMVLHNRKNLVFVFFCKHHENITGLAIIKWVKTYLQSFYFEMF